MNRDRITQVRISGLRCIGDLRLDLNGLTVLIGDNGTGKSSILEALELLAAAASPSTFVNDVVVGKHGGLVSLLRRGADALRLGISVEGAGPRLDYDLELGLVGTSSRVRKERLDVHVEEGAPPQCALFGEDGNAFLIDPPDAPPRAGQLVPSGVEVRSLPTGYAVVGLNSLGLDAPEPIQRVLRALRHVEVHTPFETRPLWQQQELEVRDGPRWPCVAQHTDRVSRYGVGLPNAFQALRNRGTKDWERVIDRARLGLGEGFRDIALPIAGRGKLELGVHFAGMGAEPLPAESLSEGQLAYLAFVAVVELHRERSLLAIDEPELHLHPMLLSRVLLMLEETAQQVPVILATHSDHLLDALERPAHSVLLCELDENRTLRVKRPDAERLAEWLEDYRGIGAVRSEGYEAHVFVDPEREDAKRP